MGGHGCIVPGRGCQAVQALEQLYQQSPTVAIVVGAALSAAYFEVLYIQVTLISMLRRSLEERAPHGTYQLATVAGTQPPNRWLAPPPSRPWVR